LITTPLVPKLSINKLFWRLGRRSKLTQHNHPFLTLFFTVDFAHLRHFTSIKYRKKNHRTKSNKRPNLVGLRGRPLAHLQQLRWGALLDKHLQQTHFEHEISRSSVQTSVLRIYHCSLQDTFVSSAFNSLFLHYSKHKVLFW